MERAMHSTARGTVREAILQAFDLLELNGSLGSARIASLGRASVGIELTEHADQDGATVLQFGLEGIVSKRLSAPPGRGGATLAQGQEPRQPGDGETS
jgi:hypothetical protein